MQAPDAVRIKVEILSVVGEPSRSPRASLQILQEPRDPKPLQIEFTKSAPQANLISSVALQGRSRAQSLCDREPETCTDLDTQVRIPWSKACQLGHGLDALTGEHTATSVFKKEFKTITKWNIRTETDFSHLQWQNVQDLRHDFEIGIGATVNVLSHPIGGASTNITNMLSETISTSTILVQYKHEVQLTPDSFPHDLSVRAGVQQLDAAAFRARYGDYYIAGYEKACSCRMIVECKTNEELVTENHKKEALALVEKYLNGAIKISDLEKETSKWSLLSVVVDTEGYSDHLNLSNRILRLEDAPGTFSDILKAATGHGFPRTAILKHYSTIPSLSHLSRCVPISPLAFETARVMRNTFAHLQDRRLHPALKEFHHDRDAIDEVLENFKRLQKYIVHAGNDVKKEKSVESLMQDLQSCKKRIDMIIERYGFIRAIMNTNPRIISHFPDHVNDRYLYRWHCGRTYGTEKDHGAESDATSTGPIQDTSFGKRHEIFRFQWTTPETSPAILSHSPQQVTFSTSDGVRPPLSTVETEITDLCSAPPYEGRR
ncbi:FHA domain-containing protein [Mycena sanguinolenta]|uniref:FHA domain-containing protein n=1 Tax=Mycena sanguinolenta TaxID=230812 RepID=A0A8H7CH87_9AGAR|nr:FHA domain-containing protein [Mycena sanguinolenta]